MKRTDSATGRIVRRGVCTAVLIAYLGVGVLAVDGDKAAYVGGTIPGLAEKAEGRLTTTSETEFSFDAGKKGAKTILYSSITGLEYGQKAGRRVAVAVLVSPLALFSKKRNHYLTVTYMDEAGKEQAGVFELGKDIVRTTLKILEVRTGKQIEPQDVDACKQFRTPKECEASK